MSHPKNSSIVVGLFCCFIASKLFAEEYPLSESERLPKFELGISLVSLQIPDYRGSADTRPLTLPVPYIRYRSKSFKIDNGIRGIFLDSDKWLLTVSAGATLPVDRENSERKGMRPLKATLGLGPSLDYKIREDQKTQLWLELPIRFAFTLEGSSRNLGPAFEPRIVWLRQAHKRFGWKLRFASGPLYVSQKRHEYFYSVSEADVADNRAAYDASGGFSGIRSDFSYSKRFKNYRIGGFVRYDSLKNSVVEDSPLVIETSTWLAGVFFSWVFREDY